MEVIMSVLKDKTWKMFSLYIKLRDADENGICTCCTCGQRMNFNSEKCHAGHFIAGRNNTVLFDENLVHAQCAKDNIWGSGEQGLYFLFMKDKYGHTDYELKALINKYCPPKKFKEFEYVEMIQKWYEEINKFKFTKFLNNKEVIKAIDEKLKSICLKKIIKLS
jgi:hypothetical protein